MTTRPTIPGPDPDTKPPTFEVPEGAADCHFHIFGPETDYPYAEPRRYTPVQVLESDYRKMTDALGLARGVVVQASPYGADNARVLEAIRVLGPGYVGVGVVDADASEERLDELNRLGIRGARINSASGGRSGIERMEELAARIKGFGWHVQFHIHAEQLPEYEEKIRKLPIDVVFDHMGLFPADLPLAHPDFQMLLRLLESGNTWVKLSGAEADIQERPSLPRRRPRGARPDRRRARPGGVGYGLAAHEREARDSQRRRFDGSSRGISRPMRGCAGKYWWIILARSTGSGNENPSETGSP